MYSNTLIKTHLTVSTNTNGASFLQNLNPNPKNLRMGEGESVEMGEGEGEWVRVNRLGWIGWDGWGWGWMGEGEPIRVNGWGWIGERLRVNGWGKGESIRVRCGWIGEWVSVNGWSWSFSDGDGWGWIGWDGWGWIGWEISEMEMAEGESVEMGEWIGWEISKTKMGEKFRKWMRNFGDGDEASDCEKFRRWEKFLSFEYWESKWRNKEGIEREEPAQWALMREKFRGGGGTSKILLSFYNIVNSAILCLELYCSSIAKKFAILLFTIPRCKSFWGLKC